METELGDLLQFEDLLDNRKLLFYPKICASQIKEIQQAGLYFRDALLPNISTISWPPKHVELCESAVKLELDAFLYTLLTGNTHIPAEYPDRLWCFVDSFGQDIIYRVTPGLQKPLKQILLPYAKQFQLIQMPHQCGHGIVPLPETIKPYINPTLTWDNIDRLEETLSGSHWLE